MQTKSDNLWDRQRLSDSGYRTCRTPRLSDTRPGGHRGVPRRPFGGIPLR